MTSTTSAISRDDIQKKFTELKDGVDAAADSARGAAGKSVIFGALALLFVVFFLGRRRGKAGKTLVEVRRL